jgi:hypothetical protein
VFGNNILSIDFIYLTDAYATYLVFRTQADWTFHFTVGTAPEAVHHLPRKMPPRRVTY